MRFLVAIIAALLAVQMPQDDNYIVIDKQHFTLTLTAPDGTAIKTYGIACGKNYGNKTRTGDHRTPEGTFRINELLNSRGIPHDFNDGKGQVKNAYGPWFLRLDVPGRRDIGIHGTHLPESIGTRCTEGCIRLRNEDITDLKSRVHVGTVVIILPDELAE
ncbi:MAG: L,D-transpeptidase [Bacteroidales bacterium]|nr:L,D-transpeptidase [Bacteroidales bacterium]